MSPDSQKTFRNVPKRFKSVSGCSGVFKNIFSQKTILYDGLMTRGPPPLRGGTPMTVLRVAPLVKIVYSQL